MIDWEENLFVGLKSLWRRVFVTPSERKLESVQATLSDLRHELFLLAHLVAGQSLKLFETDEDLLWKDGYIFLPSKMRSARAPAANADLYRIKTVLGALAFRENWCQADGDIEALIDSGCEEFPFLGEKIDAIRSELHGGANLSDTLGQLPEAGTSPESEEPTNGSVLEHKGIHAEDEEDEGEVIELEGKGRSEVESIESREDFGTGSEMPEHVFEKVETLEEYDGQSRKSEADEDLPEHKEALDELRMTQVMRSRERPRSIYRADLMLDGGGFDVSASPPADGIPYPEWDYRRHRYRQNWCFVKENWRHEFDSAWVSEVTRKRRKLLDQLRRQFAAMTSDWMRVRRQPFGPELDIDAVIAAEVDRRIGRWANELIYQSRERDVQDSAALLLFDQSYSTDSWLDNARVLDTIRETIFCCGEVLHEFVESFALAGFHSNTRQDCRFDWLKDYHEPWPNARGRLGTVEAHGYTRIGPALRHAQESLANVGARKKVIILVTDGRPCDYDRYEGRYGIHDVKKAIETGKKEGIQTHAYAIERRAAEYFPKMFTRDHYDIVPNPEHLAQHLCRLFMRLN